MKGAFKRTDCVTSPDGQFVGGFIHNIPIPGNGSVEKAAVGAVRSFNTNAKQGALDLFVQEPQRSPLSFVGEDERPASSGKKQGDDQQRNGYSNHLTSIPQRRGSFDVLKIY